MKAILLALFPFAQEGDAVAWNRVGIERLDRGEIPAAIEAFEKARALRPEDAVIRRNLAVARGEEGERARASKEPARAAAAFKIAAELDPERARYRIRRAQSEDEAGNGADALEILREAARAFPTEASVHEWLGVLEHRAGRLEEAAVALGRACALDPSRTDLAAALERVRRDAEVEAGYAREGSSHFDFRYDGERRDLAKGAGVLARMLDDAFEQVGTELGFFPRERFQVVLYEGNAFREVTGTGEWVGGLFDGRIRLPVGPLFRERERLRAAILHETGHAFLHRLAPGLPAWAHEGIAQRLEGRSVAAADGAARAAKERLLGPADLRKPFLELGDRARVSLAYSQSLSFTDWLRRTAGWESVLRYLSRVKEEGEEKAFADALGAPFDEALARWREELLR